MEIEIESGNHYGGANNAERDPNVKMLDIMKITMTAMIMIMMMMMIIKIMLMIMVLMMMTMVMLTSRCGRRSCLLKREMASLRELQTWNNQTFQRGHHHNNDDDSDGADDVVDDDNGEKVHRVGHGRSALFSLRTSSCCLAT